MNQNQFNEELVQLMSDAKSLAGEQGQTIKALREYVELLSNATIAHHILFKELSAELAQTSPDTISRVRDRLKQQLDSAVNEKDRNIHTTALGLIGGNA